MEATTFPREENQGDRHGKEETGNILCEVPPDRSPEADSRGIAILNGQLEEPLAWGPAPGRGLEGGEVKSAERQSPTALKCGSHALNGAKGISDEAVRDRDHHEERKQNQKVENQRAQPR